MHPRLIDALRDRGIVVLCGAGISMAPPSSLPSWWDFNRDVLRGLADRLASETSTKWVEGRFDALIERRETLRAFTPDFMAQLMAEEVGLDYFRCLEALDADAWNTNHAVLAALARAGRVRAIVTTNFDRLLERALIAVGVEHRVFASTASYEGLEAALASPASPLPLIKAHGSVEDPASMVDTLAQRVAGRPKALEDAITSLLRTHACLTLGFSGEDLAYDAGYLGLRAAATDGVLFHVLVLPGSRPRPAMRALLDAWGARGVVSEGVLPQSLLELAECVGVAVTPVADDGSHPPWKDRLAERTHAWVHSLGTVSAVNMFTALVDANGDDDQLLRYLMFFRRYYRSTEDALRPRYWRFEHNLGRRLLDRGLIGTIEPEAAGLVPEALGRDVEARDYVDALQFLARAAQLGRLPEAEADLTRLLALKVGHGRVRGNVQALVARLANERADPASYEIALLAAEFAEELGETDNGVLFSRLAFAIAQEMGDEPRRAGALARGARLLALVKDYDTAVELTTEALGIASRLALPVLEGDALAARGMVDVLRSCDAEAVEPLTRACALFRRMQRRPRLALALCDLARAQYYAGQGERAAAALEECQRLAELLPGLHIQGLLAELEILEHAGQQAEARRIAERLIEAGTALGHDTGVARGTRALTRLGGDGA